MFQIATCSRCGKKIGLVTALVHDEKKLCLTCIVDDERAERELKQKQEPHSQSQYTSIDELEALRDSGAIPEEVFKDAKKSLLQGRPVIIERAMPEPDKQQPKVTKQNTAPTSMTEKPITESTENSKQRDSGMSTGKWYYLENKERKGPFSEEQIANFIRMGAITASTLLWTDGFENWRKVQETGLLVYLQKNQLETQSMRNASSHRQQGAFQGKVSKKLQRNNEVSSLWYKVPIGLIVVLWVINIIFHILVLGNSPINGGPSIPLLIFSMFASFLMVATIAIVTVSIILIPVRIAKRKGQDAEIAWFIFSLVLFPIALLASLLIHPEEEVIERRKFETGESVKCPYCAEWIKPEARVCKHCGRDL